MMIKILAKVFTMVGQVVDFFHRLDERIVNFVLEVITKVREEMKVGGHND